ncbi:sensor histidine kinase [Muricoccus radiodurans]|uniref:sensor histidine kinase n=1 Tax=Muricoccus radiodurans TaxID=2231721 RepID=UPI003CF77400
MTADTLPESDTAQRLAWAEERLAFAMEASGLVGAWDWDVAADLVHADARFCRLYGVDPALGEAGTPVATFTQAVHPDDLPHVQAAIATALEAEAPLNTEYRLRQPDGTERWVLVRGRAIRDAGGRTVRFPGIALDITDRKASEAALRESEARFRKIADTMPQVVWSTLPDGHHDYYNRRWYELTGTTPGTTDGEGWAGLFHPDDQPLAWERWRHALATGEPYEVEYRLRMADGSWRWFLGRALPVRDAQGRIERWFGTCTDIHDIRRAAEEREILSHELSHRIKNIFSVTSSLISLSARGHPEAADFAEELRGRITALGRAHEFARPHSEDSRPGLGRTTLFGFLHDLLSPYATRKEERVSIQGDDCIFDDAAATPLALLFHELATNAAKYGALSNPAGRVAITVRREDEEIVLSWQERGGPPVPGPPGREGFGTKLAMISVQGQLGGKVSRRWPPEGLELETRLSADALNRRRRARQKA